MIYELNGVFYLKSGNTYELANIEIKYSNLKKKNVLVITGSGVVKNIEGSFIEYDFKKLEEKLLKGELA